MIERIRLWLLKKLGVINQEDSEFYKGYANCTRYWMQGSSLEELNNLLNTDKSYDAYRRGWATALEDVSIQTRYLGIQNRKPKRQRNQPLW